MSVLATDSLCLTATARSPFKRLLPTMLVEELKGSRAASATLVGEWNRQESSRRPVFLEDQVGAVQRGVLSGSLQGKLTQRERKALERGVE